MQALENMVLDPLLKKKKKKTKQYLIETTYSSVLLLVKTFLIKLKLKNPEQERWGRLPREKGRQPPSALRLTVMGKAEKSYVTHFQKTSSSESFFLVSIVCFQIQQLTSTFFKVFLPKCLQAKTSILIKSSLLGGCFWFWLLNQLFLFEKFR